MKKLVVFLLVCIIFACKSGTSKNNLDTVKAIYLDSIKSDKTEDFKSKFHPNFELKGKQTLNLSKEISLKLKNLGCDTVGDWINYYYNFTIKNNGTVVFEQDSILSLGEFSYDSLSNNFIIPIVTSNDDVHSTFDIVLVDFNKNNSKILEHNVGDATNVEILADKSFLYIANDTLIKYKDSERQPICRFLNESDYLIKWIKNIDNQTVRVIFFKEFPLDGPYKTDIKY